MNNEGATMTATNVNISIGGELGERAQSVLADLGLDVPTAVNMFLTRVVNRGTRPDDFDMSLDFVALPEKKPKMSREEMFGCMRGQFKMADDFDAPLEDFKEYME